MRALIGIGLLLLTSTGCAAVFKGSKQEVRFVAIPGESDVRIDGQFKGATPTTAELDRDRSQNVVVSKDGFKEQSVQVRKHNDTPWFFWDIGTCVIPITLCIPVLVDAISGAWYSFDDEYRVKLEPLPVAVRPAVPAVALPPAPTSVTPETGL